MKYLVGSKLLGLTNAKDEDYIEIINKGKQYRKCKNGIDITYITEEQLKDYMDFKITDMKSIFKCLVNYQLDKEIIGDSFPYDYHILNYKKEVLTLIGEVINDKLFNFNKRVTINNNCCFPSIYHIVYNLFIIKNKSPHLTSGQKRIIEIIHDGKMPIDYLNDITQLFYKLKEEEK